ncbi:hypothetical protein SAY86_005652 [Trapa natans]|uniref:Uncharacterized protein n=1 Tax=Trapa natans TaxID=22666 RepID=A0AAN7L3A8_TRANT|nr:hypothetical protein SAY86_005652 [Trapa natans]
MKCPYQFHSYIDENAVLVAYEIMPSLIGHNDISSVAGTVSKYQQMIGQGYEDSQEKTVKYMVYLLKTLDYSCLLGTSMSLKIFYCHFPIFLAHQNGMSNDIISFSFRALLH